MKFPALSPRERGCLAAGAFTSRSGKRASRFAGGGEGPYLPSGTESATAAQSRG